MTINEVLVLQKAVRTRMEELRGLRNQVARRESYLYGQDEKKVIEPQYDVKAVDKKITELETFLYKSESLVKNSNAKTEVELTVDVDKLLAPLQ